MTNEKPKKVFTTGALRATVWENTHKNKEGVEFTATSVKLERTYKVGNEYKSTNSMRQDDVPKAILILQKAYEYLVTEYRQEEKEGGEE